MATDIKSYRFKAGFRHEIEVLPLKKLYTEYRDILSQPHRADFYHIFWFQQAPQVHVVDFKPIRNLNNTLLFVNKHQVQTFQKIQKVTGKVLLFTDDFFAKSNDDLLFIRNSILFNDFLDTATFKVSARSNPIIECFTEIEEELVEKEDGHTYDILRNLLHTLLLRCEREYRRLGHYEIKKGADLDYTTLFRDLLNSQYKSLRSVRGYASQINVSEKRLTNATTKTLGKTPKELIDERVMLEAKRLLVHTLYSIKEIGYELGFEEPTNFIKFFKKHAEKTPIEFRESH
ncbi:AraC-type DNA-binding protein [Chitinophaga sp. CF418]|nr:AraC-type DNA-binding protein [Chitinophaga sp. CF418]